MKGGENMVEFQKKTEYILMNKGCCILSFVCARNAYDEPTFQELQWYVDYRPIGYKTLIGFLERRKAPKHREHIQPLLERFGFPVSSSLVSKLCGLRFGFLSG